MATTFRVPPNTRVDNDPDHTSDHDDISNALAAAASFIVTNEAFGGDATGAADSTASFQAAYTAWAAAQGLGNLAVEVPAGTYRCDAGQWKPPTGLRVRGAGWEVTTITCDGSAQTGAPHLWNLDPPGFSTSVHLENLHVSGIHFSVTNADLFWGVNMVRSRFTDNLFSINSNGYSVMNVSDTTGTNGATYMAECYFRNTEKIGGSSRTVPAWNLDFSGTGLRCNDNTWEGGQGTKIFPVLGGDTSQYWFVCKGDAAGSRGSKHNTWQNLIFELSGVSNAGACGGLIHLMQMEIVLIDNISMEDLSSGTVGNPLILLNTIGGGAEGCHQVTISNYSRRSGSNVSSTNPDIKLDGNCDSITIRDPKQASGGSGLIFDFQNATNVTIAGPKAGNWTVLNAGTGFHAPPAAGASFTPADPASTTSGSLVMMGLGATCTYTPAGTGQVLAVITGQATTATASVAMTVGARRGTSTAPANGAAVTGTAIGADQTIRPAGTAGGVGFTFTRVMNLTPGTMYWIDLAIGTTNAADAAKVTSVDVSLVELP